MSTESNVYSQGGGGTHYEFEIQTAFFINFLIGGIVPGLSESHITEFRQQAGSIGYNTDDLLLKCINTNSVEQRVLFQIKHNLIISEGNNLFKEVLKAAWTDFKNTSLFDSKKDKIYLVKSNLTLWEKNHLKQLLNWAKLKADVDDYKNEMLKIEGKKRYFDLFKSVLTQSDIIATDQDLFHFFKCLDLLEYDFGHQVSVSKSNFLTLIEFSKTNTTLSASQIWDTIFRFVSDSDSKGGFFTNTNIPDEISGLFNKAYFNPIEKKLRTLSQQNFEIIEFIDNTIGGINMDRKTVIEHALDKLNKSQFLILSGDPGIGKSAIAKSLLLNSKTNTSGYILSFKADDLNDKNIRDIFSQFDIHLTVKEVISHFPLFNENIIYVDSVEKLLEGEGIGFKQLLKTIQDTPNLKFIISCRSANLNLIELKFFHSFNYEKLEIPSLTDEELDLISSQLPVIEKIRKNKRITSLLKVPKYLDYTVRSVSETAEDFSDLSEVDFIDKLWSTIVENKINENLDGLPIRRSHLFIELSVKRSKKMLPFVNLDFPDPQALSKMINENVIIKSAKIETYAPAHDVLEDWALIRYVIDQFGKCENDNDFFQRLGTEPAMRRAYRLWVQNVLKQQDSLAIEFFTRNLRNSQLDRFWQDESLIAVLNSAYCQSFFEKNLEYLKENDWNLFFRIIHIMRTACRENSSTSKDSKFLVPTGYGWEVIINLIHQLIKDIPSKYYDFIFYLISEWSHKIFVSPELPPITRQAGLITIHLLNNHFLKSSRYAYDDKKVDRCINLIFDLCGGIITEVTEMLNKARTEAEIEETDEDWISKRYHAKILELSLSDLKSVQLAKFLPDLLINIAKEKWYRKPPKPLKHEKDFLFPISDHSWDDVNYHFGLIKKYDLDYFPASGYQTPVLWLLRNQPLKAIDFIIELINYSTDKYLVSEFSKDDGCIDVELTIYDGSKIVQHGSVVLWCMYRGTGKVTPYLLQSVLMALEYYLLEIAQWGDDYKEYLQNLLHILYTKSKSVATTAVISSVCQAYPLMVGDKLLPLFTNRKLITWDVSRFTQDFHPFNLRSDKEIFDNERLKSDKLPHRLKYTPGIKGFIVDYCFNIRALNEKIFEILDKHRKEASPGDLEWLKMLDDMDIRTWKLTKTEVQEDGKTSFFIEPSYGEEVQEFIDEGKEPMEESHKNTSFKVWLLDVENNKKSASIEHWREIFNYYSAIKEYSFYEHTPGLVAGIGIRDLWVHLNDNEKAWCVNNSLEIINNLIGNQYKPYNTSINISPFDDSAVLSIVPLLLTLPELKENEEDIEKLFITLLTTHFHYNDPAYSRFLQACDTTLWNLNPNKALKYFKGLIAFSRFTKMNPFYIDQRHKQEEVDAHFDKLNTLIDNIYKGIIELRINDINFEEYSKWILQKTILFLPRVNPPPECIHFIKKIIELYLVNESIKRRDRDNDLRLHEIRIVLREKVSNIVFWNIDSVGEELMEYFLNKIHDANILANALNTDNEIFLFFRSTIENLIIITDHNLPLDDPLKTQNTVQLFEKVWKKFEQILSEKKSPVFTDLLLLNISWNDAAISWLPIDNLSGFFENTIKKYGPSQLQAVINLLSHIGDKTLMPPGINWLVTIIKASESKFLFAFKHSEKLMLRAYDNHLTEIKGNKELFTNYLWFLDEMVDQGSSDAYWIREFLVSFR